MLTGQDTQRVPRKQDRIYWNKTWQSYTDFSFGSWNIRSLYRPGSAQTLVQELEKYRLHLVALQEVRWQGTGSLKIGDGTIMYGDCGQRHEFGTGFYIHKTINDSVKEFEHVNNRISYITIQTQWLDITFLNAHAPTEDKDDDTKEEFYSQLEHTYNSISKHNVKVVLGDFNAKVGKEEIYKPTIGNFSLHEESSDNGVRLINFAMTNDLTLSSTKFQHKRIHLGTWISPDGKVVNQIDHVAIQKRFQNSIKDVRTFRGADCDTDHMLIISKMKIKLKKNINRNRMESTKYNLRNLSEKNIKESFRKEMESNLTKTGLDNRELQDVENRWSHLKNTIQEVATKVIGKRKQPNKKWFNMKCQEKVMERRNARKAWIEDMNDSTLKERYYKIRRDTQRTLRQEKRDYYNGMIREAEEDFKHHRTRQMYQNIKKSLGKFTKREQFIKDEHGKILTSKRDIQNRWKTYFSQLLNCNDPQSYFIFKEADTADIQVTIPSLNEIQLAVKKLKNNKACGEDQIYAELLKSGGPQLELELHSLIETIWKSETIPTDWKTAIICPIFKKNDPLVCDNYRGIALLDVTYKILSMCLLNRLIPITEEVIGDYQCGFRRNRSTLDHLYTLRQITEKAWEFNEDVHILFIDFRKAYDSIHRQTLLNIMKEFQIPSKLIRLVKICIDETFCCIKTPVGETENFKVLTGLRQGDAISPILFNLVLEKIDREFRKTSPQGIQMQEANITRLAYADDIALISSSKPELIKMMQNYYKIAEKTGLQVNEEKTEYLVVSKKIQCDAPLVVDGFTFKSVNHFKYLGSLFSNNNRTDIEINARLASANRTLFSFIKILKKKSLSRNFKIRLYQSTIIPVTLYGCEALTFRKKDEEKLLVFERKVLRKIFGPVYDQNNMEWRIRKNEELKQLYKQPNIVELLKKRRLNWAGHVARMEETRLPKIAFCRAIDGTRGRGRPRIRWRDNIREDTRRMNISTEWTWRARNRNKWKRLVEQVYGQ